MGRKYGRITTPGTGDPQALRWCFRAHRRSLADTYGEPTCGISISRKRYWRARHLPNHLWVAPVPSVIGVDSFNWRRKVTGAALSYLASPLGLMLAFRVNSVVSRFHEGRSQWGQVRFVPIDPTFPSEDDARPLAHLLVQMIFNARNIASLISASETDVVDDQVKATACRLLVAFGWAAKAHARYEDDLSGVLSALLGEEEAERASAARQPALHVLALLRKTVQPLQLPLAVSEQLQTAISELYLCSAAWSGS